MSFAAGPHLDVHRYDGPLITLLECDSNELLGTGWRNAVQKSDWPVTDAITADIEHGHGGTYIVHAISKTGDVYLLQFHIIVDAAGGITRGTASLVDYILKRKYFPIKNAVLRRGDG